MNLEEGLYSGEKGPERTDTGKKTGIWGELKNVFNINKSFFLEKFSFKELYMLGKYIISECKKCKDPEYKKCKEGKLQEEEIQKEYRDFISFLIQKYNLRLVNYDVESLIIDVKDNELVIKQGSKEFIIREGTKPLKLEDFSLEILLIF